MQHQQGMRPAPPAVLLTLLGGSPVFPQFLAVNRLQLQMYRVSVIFLAPAAFFASGLEAQTHSAMLLKPRPLLTLLRGKQYTFMSDCE